MKTLTKNEPSITPSDIWERWVAPQFSMLQLQSGRPDLVEDLRQQFLGEMDKVPNNRPPQKVNVFKFTDADMDDLAKRMAGVMSAKYMKDKLDG